MLQSIPVIDIAPWFKGDAAARAAVARTVGDACTNWGFLIIQGHGIDTQLMQSIKDVTYAFFDLATEEKLKCDSTGRPGGRGYYRVASKSHARTRGDATAPGDLRETFFAGAEPIPGSTYTSAPEA